MSRDRVWLNGGVIGAEPSRLTFSRTVSLGGASLAKARPRLDQNAGSVVTSAGPGAVSGYPATPPSSVIEVKEKQGDGRNSLFMSYSCLVCGTGEDGLSFQPEQRCPSCGGSLSSRLEPLPPTATFPRSSGEELTLDAISVGVLALFVVGGALTALSPTSPQWVKGLAVGASGLLVVCWLWSFRARRAKNAALMHIYSQGHATVGAVTKVLDRDFYEHHIVVRAESGQLELIKVGDYTALPVGSLVHVRLCQRHPKLGLAFLGGEWRETQP